MHNSMQFRLLVNSLPTGTVRRFTGTMLAFKPLMRKLDKPKKQRVKINRRRNMAVSKISFLSSLHLQALILQACLNLAASGAGSIVEFLPGFPGGLPFELETGYIGVGESEEVQLFYYFIKSESNPEGDPLLLWLTGGPGCSSFTGLAYEIGPVSFEKVEYKGSLPKLVLNPHSWTKVGSIIFLDLPVGTGFSYAKTPKALHSTDLQACDQAHEFLRKWLVEHSEYLSNPFYVGGDSYAGMIVPIITQLISNGNDAGVEPKIDLKGYLLGNPRTSTDDFNSRVPMAHGMGLISDELYQSLQRTCEGKYDDTHSNNDLCQQYMQTYNRLVKNINFPHILEPYCAADAPKPFKLSGKTRSLYEMLRLEPQDVKIRQEVSPLKCRSYWRRISYYWANDGSVQEALHVRKGSIEEWQRCNRDLLYTMTIENAVPYHANLSSKGYRSLIYSGDHDLGIPFFGTQAWIRSLNYPIVDDWRQWTLAGQIAGYTRTYANKMTFATVKGGGHTAPEYRPSECKAMFERWISAQPL